MKRLLNNLLCATVSAAMIMTTLPTAAIAEATQEQSQASQQAAETANQESATAQSEGDQTSQEPTQDSSPNIQPSYSAQESNESNGDVNDQADTNQPAQSAPLAEQLNNTPTATATQSATADYTHTATASQNGVTFTVAWNDAPAGTETTFHVTQSSGSAAAKARMDVPTYWDTDWKSESVCDPSRSQWSGASSYKTIGNDGYDFSFEFTASGKYNIYFYFMDTNSGIGYLWTTDAWATVNKPMRPSVTQIVNNAVAQAKTMGSEYEMALWLYDWAIDQLGYGRILNYFSAESGLTWGLGTYESYQRIYAKLLNAADNASRREEG